MLSSLTRCFGAGLGEGWGKILASGRLENKSTRKIPYMWVLYLRMAHIWGLQSSLFSCILYIVNKYCLINSI
jgi:hypothetical protein